LNKRMSAARAETAEKKSYHPVEKHSCGMKSVAVEEPHEADGDLDRSTPACSSVPCGGDPDLSPATAENLKFLRSCLVHSASRPTFDGQYLSKHHIYTSRYVPPPDPPPKLSTLS
jgi:hypothetical protein